MIVYAVAEEDDDDSDRVLDGAMGSEGDPPRRVKKSIDTKLTIDTDQFTNNSEIKIVYINGEFAVRPTCRP